MTRCQGCGCPLDPNLDIILQERVTLPGVSVNNNTKENEMGDMSIGDNMEPGQAYEVLPAVRPTAGVSLGNLRGVTGSEIITSATEMATSLAAIINDRGLYKNIQGKDYVVVEGWTTLATMCGLMPREVACENIGDGVYVAVVALVRISDGVELTRASAECGAPDELDRNGVPLWSARPQYARRSMAITRATSKVCRIALSWVMTLAGYAPTPAEEMTTVEANLRAPTKPPVAEKPIAPQKTIGEEKVKAIWKLAAVRVKELVERGDVAPDTKPDIIMRSLLLAWNLEHTADIPAKLYDAFVNLVNKWVPDQPREEMQLTAGEVAF